MSKTTTPIWQRVAIWIIAIAMLGGTIVGFVFMVLATQDSDIDPQTIAENMAYEQQAEAYEEWHKQQVEAAKEDQKKLLPLEGYEDKVTPFEAGSVTELTVETIVEGNGATISEGDYLTVYYTGWTPNGKMFDSSRRNDTDEVSTAEFQLDSTQLIEGWVKGLTGKRVGGTYLLSVPADLAYGSDGDSSGLIQPDEPIKFIVQVVKSEARTE